MHTETEKESTIPSHSNSEFVIRKLICKPIELRQLNFVLPDALDLVESFYWIRYVNWLHLNPALNSCREGPALLELRSSQGKAWVERVPPWMASSSQAWGQASAKPDCRVCCVLSHPAQCPGNILPCLWHQSCLRDGINFTQLWISTEGTFLDDFVTWGMLLAYSAEKQAFLRWDSPHLQQGV